jgi:hypothetical protein
MGDCGFDTESVINKVPSRRLQNLWEAETTFSGGKIMAHDDANLELIQLLDLPAGTPLDERLWRWAVAFEAWLEERRTGFHPNVGFDSHLAWSEFLAFTGKPPGKRAPRMSKPISNL